MYQVQEVIGKRVHPKTKKVQYKIKWIGFHESQSTWEPEDHLTFVKELIEKYEKENRKKPEVASRVSQSKKKTNNPSISSPKKHPCKFRKNEDDYDMSSSGDNHLAFDNFMEAAEKPASQDVPRRTKAKKYQELAMKLKKETPSPSNSLCSQDEVQEANEEEPKFDCSGVPSQKPTLNRPNFKVLKIKRMEKTESGLFYLAETSKGKLWLERQQIFPWYSEMLCEFYEAYFAPA